MVNLEKQLESPSTDETNVETRHPYRRFSLAFLGSAAVPMLLMAGFNAFVNPYGVFETRAIAEFNQAKPEKLKNMRLFKAVEVNRVAPRTLFLGSSRTDYGMNPQHPALSNLQPAYNLGLGASNTEEMRRYLEHVLANHEVERVVMGLDEFMFNVNNRDNVTFEMYRLNGNGLTLKDAIDTTFSLNAFSASLETIQTSRQYPDYVSYSPQGQLNLRPIDLDPTATDYRFNTSLSVYFQSFPQPYDFDDRSIRELKNIVEMCRERGIDLYVYISPSHATRYETIRTAGHWAEYERMKREIARVVPYWDFSGFNSITTEPISEEMQNYIDDSHYHPDIGDVVLNKLLDHNSETVPDDFGVWVTPDNVDEHLANIRRDREMWAQNNPEEVQLVRDVQASVLENLDELGQ